MLQLNFVCISSAPWQRLHTRFGAASTVVTWEVSLGDTGKIITLRSGVIITNHTQVPIQVGILHRSGTAQVIGVVAGPGTMAIPADIPSAESLVFRPSHGETRNTLLSFKRFASPCTPVPRGITPLEDLLCAASELLSIYWIDALILIDILGCMRILFLISSSSRMCTSRLCRLSPCLFS